MNDTPPKPKSSLERIEILEAQNSELQKQLAFEKYKIDTLQTQLGNSNGNIANLLTVFSVLFAIFSIIFGIYIQRLYRKIKRANKIAQTTHGQVEQIRKDIDENFRKIYDNIVKEELTTILQRLSDVPEDIQHYSSFFFGRKSLPREIYEELTVLISLCQERIMTEIVRGQSLGRYFLIVLQYYPRKAFENESLWSLISPNLREQLNAFHHQDMLNFMSAIFENRHPDWFNQNESKLLWLFGSWFFSPYCNIIYLKELHTLVGSNISEVKAILEKEPKLKYFLDTLIKAGQEPSPA